MSIFRNRLVRGYIVLFSGIIALFTRRLIAPDILDISPLSVSVTLLNANCYAVPTFQNCSDPLIVFITTLALVVTLGWGSILGYLIAIALILPVLALYFFLAAIWFVLFGLLLLPLLMYVFLDVWLVKLLQIE